MLNFDVKRKINTLRDILVGKVPDPKAQVEQITIALIYKFMDDMDMDGVAFGGNREFFKGEYDKYAFSQLMQSENSAQQRLNLYAEGIEKMTINPHLPQLFRDIFRGAYIPYRDPETLNMFLKEIAEFTYSDSEDLGNAFEYLLSIMGSQGDAGQFRTPRHIIDMMVDIIAPQKYETILDPACGTAGFLISAYKYIESHNRDENGVSTLTADDKNRMTANFAGYDISPDMVRLSRVNMYLHGFTKPPISEYDTLTSLEKWDDTYDVIFANPPFMTPKGGIIPHSRYRNSAKRSEVLFVDYIAEHINPTGRAAVIVPEGIVFQSATAYTNLRKYLVDDGLLYAVISLPAGVFNPYSGVKTSILLMDKTLAKLRDSILFVKLNNDGYDLGAQRREIKGSEIADIINVIREYQQGVDVAGQANVTLAKKNAIADKDYILVGERYKATVVVDTQWPMVKLGDVCSYDRQLTTSTDGIYVGMEDIESNNGIVSPLSLTGKNQAGTGNAYVFSEKHVLYGRLRPYLNKVATPGFSGRCSTELIPILPRENINKNYLARILRSEFSVSFAMGTNTGARMPRTDMNAFLSFRFPLPPLSVQEEIVAEIENYQKIIDGARQIVDNYNPNIKIDPVWEMVKLGDICEIVRGSSPRPAGDPRYYGGNVPRLMVADVTRDGMYVTPCIDYLTDEGAKLSRPMKKGSLVMAVSGQPGTCAILEIDACIHDGFVGFRNVTKSFIIEFLYLYLTSIKEKNNSLSVGAVFKNLKTEQIDQFQIPVVPIEIQREIVSRINEEMTIVGQNKRLIDIFQQKIKDTVADVWGNEL